MHKGKTIFPTLLVFLFLISTAFCEDKVNEDALVGGADTTDTRQLVEMPEQARQLLRGDMLSHLSALNQIFTYMAENNLKAAANVAENQLGVSAMGKHRGSGMGPGRFMPLEMRQIGWSMHESATQLAQHLIKDELTDSYQALQQVTAACVACHYSYRAR